MPLLTSGIGRKSFETSHPLGFDDRALLVIRALLTLRPLNAGLWR